VLTNFPVDPRHALEVLLVLTRELTHERPLEESLKLVTDAALDVMHANHASIRLLDGSRETLLARARSGTPIDRPSLVLKRGEGIIGWVVERGEGALLKDALADPRFVPAPGRDSAVRSLIVEPVWSGGEVIGALSVSSKRADLFGADEQLLVRLLANCTVPPVERARLKRLAIYDDLTQAYNQRYLAPRLDEEVERARRSNGSVCILLLDLDHFKAVNDAHGHAVGDRVLRLFADRVRAIVRKPDVLVRRGGDEFVLIMPAVSDQKQGLATARRIQQNLQKEPLVVSPDVRILQTVSIGVINWDGRESPAELEERADRAMYEAKREGRNRVVLVAAPP
jgi:two-component system, cell cycle response regulator